MAFILKKHIAILLLLIAGLPATVRAVPENAPVSAAFGVIPQGELRVFAQKNQFTFYGGAVARNELQNVRYRSGTLGVYYRPISNLRLGVFYQRQWGVRHDEDWVWSQGLQRWVWSNVNDRGEDQIIVDVTPRLLMDFLLSKDWVAEVKTRLRYNNSNSQQTLTVRPGLTYFWMHQGDPLFEFFIQCELYFPLNYANSTIYETWGYLGGLYHLSKGIQVGLNAALKTVNWGNSVLYRTNTLGGSFQVQEQSLMIGFLSVIRFD